MNVEKRKQAIQWLLDTYPKAFKLTDRRPLMLDVFEEIQKMSAENMPDTNALQDALDYYTQWGSYLNALSEGAVRINLTGQPEGSVSQQEENDAQAILAAAAKKLKSSH